jgi:hypothetical protein
MSEEKKELTKEEKIEKAKELMKKVKELELNEDELKKVAGGTGCYWGAQTNA